MSLVTSYQSAQAGSPCSDVASGHGSLEEVSFAKDGLNVGEKSGCVRGGIEKTKVSCLLSWPLTVQASDLIQSQRCGSDSLQGESSMVQG